MNNNSFNELSASQLLRKRTEEENSPPQRMLPCIPSFIDITTHAHPNKQDTLAKANYHIKQSIDTLMNIGVDPVPVIINAIMEHCPGCTDTISSMLTHTRTSQPQFISAPPQVSPVCTTSPVSPMCNPSPVSTVCTLPPVSPVSTLLTIPPINHLKDSLPNSNVCNTSMTSTHCDNHLIESGVVMLVLNVLKCQIERIK